MPKTELQQMTGPCVLPDEEWIDTVHHYMDNFDHGKTASDTPYFLLVPVINKGPILGFFGGDFVFHTSSSTCHKAYLQSPLYIFYR